MDPFEEFEFKPLTDGLGFHHRSQPEKADFPLKNPAQGPTAKIDFALELMAPDMTTPQIQPALPRKPENKPAASKVPTSPVNSTVDEILKTLGERRKYDFEEKSTAKAIYQTPSIETFIPSSFEFSAALLDGMLIVASYLAAMIVLLVVTKVDLFGTLLNADEESMIYLSLFGIFTMVTWVYLVATRLFLGFTPGEWVFDQRLGQPEQLGTAPYSLKVALRSILVVATGFIVIPLLSMISRRDLLGRLMGVELVRKV